MGTRADFYAGRGKDAEWLGSIAWDGTEIPDEILYAHDEAMFRSEVAAFLAGRDDGTLPADGWPWPWNTSSTTDCSYWFFDSKCWDAHKEWAPVGDVYAPFDKDRPEWDGEQDEDEFYTAWLTGRPTVEYPNMADKKRLTLGKRSGVIVVAG